jgi:hypothetical protein
VPFASFTVVVNNRADVIRLVGKVELRNVAIVVGSVSGEPTAGVGGKTGLRCTVLESSVRRLISTAEGRRFA